MSTRRRSIHRKPKVSAGPPEKQAQEHGGPANVEALEESRHNEVPQVQSRQTAQENYLPVALVLEILAREYEDNIQGEALCRVAVYLAEESGVIEKYRSRWDEEDTGLSSRQSVLLFDRRQSMELIRYFETKNNQEALGREKAKLRQLEGRLLLGRSDPARITEQDLEDLERYIKESGF